MPLAVIVSFVVLFALILFAVTAGLKFLDSRRKKQVVDMLQTAAGENAPTITTLLKELEPDKPTGFKAVVRSLEFTRHAQEMLQQAGMTWSPTRLLAMMALLTVPGFALGMLWGVLISGPVTGVAFALVFACIPYLFVRHKRKVRLDKMEEQLPEALDFLARSMRAGHAFSISLEMVGEEIADPLGQEFRTLFNEQNLGAPLDIAMRNFTQRVPLLDVRFFTSSVLLQKQTGGNLSEILSRLAYVIRERFRLKGQVKAASAHGRLTATILTLLPVFTMFGLLVVAPGYLQSMANDSDGKWLIGGAIVAQILGNFFIKKIINIKV
ncbi:MAG TPA: type II secretion system F family protein [Verrucomicrobiae bacterium]|nr:type II secretion system F family protein [Verrucomicrobiae bacterium]